jgi:amidase
MFEEMLKIVGYPSATVPLGNLENGHPYGLFLLARAHREDLLFRFMSAFEATFREIDGPVLDVVEGF